MKAFLLFNQYNNHDQVIAAMKMRKHFFPNYVKKFSLYNYHIYTIAVKQIIFKAYNERIF